MVESRRILVPFVLLMITASVTTQQQFLFVVMDVDDITLPCENVIRDNSPSCDGTVWLFSDSSSFDTVTLVTSGQIDERAKAKRDRLSVTANCSLVVKKVTDEDAGWYGCRRSESGQQEFSQVVLSMVNMTEHRSHDEVTLSCSVATFRSCRHAVRWLLQGQRVDGGNTDTSTFQSGCQTNVTVSTSRFRDASKKNEIWTCEVTDGFTREVHLFPFSSAESSGETTAVTGQSSSVITRAGDEVTLPCYNVIDDQDRCDATSWISSRYSERTTAELITLGQINKNGISKAKSDRLSVAADCSLVIRNVTVEDAGIYSCRHYRSGQEQGGDASILLSVVTITEDTVNGTVFFFCSVSTYDCSSHTVEWLYGGNNTHVEVFPSSCSVRLGFLTQSKIEGLRCSVTDTSSGKTLLFNVGPPSKTAIGSTSEGKNNTSSAKNDTPTKPGVGHWLVLVIVSVVLAALLIIAVAVIRWTKTRGNKTKMDESNGLSLNHHHQADAETSQELADPEDGVFYASINHTNKTGTKVQVRDEGGDVDEGDVVTYSTVNTSSSSGAGASADLSSLYSTVAKPRK